MTGSFVAMKSFLKISVTIPEENYLTLSEWTADQNGFLGLEEGFDQMTLYFTDQEIVTQTVTDWLDAQKHAGLISSYQIDSLPDQNWNGLWESEIKPIIIDDFFCIYPGWSPPGQTWPVSIRIDPKMSFGTGYHETTRLMLRALRGLNLTGKPVLDCGTGTGVLAIAALKLGSPQVMAFDIDEWSVKNTRENLELNGISEQLTLREGDFSIVRGTGPYPVILSNVNRVIHLQEVDFYKTHLQPGGILLISGLLSTDETLIRKAFQEAGFSLLRVLQENEWIAMEWTR